jgi:selenide,water dikinase
MQSSSPAVRDLVLVGGGHAHVQVLKHFAMNPVPGIRLTLVSEQDVAIYSGMVPGYLAGHYGLDDIQIPLEPLCRFAKARFINAEVCGLDPANNRLILSHRPDLGFDLLSLNCGAQPDLGGMPGIPVKPIYEFVRQWPELARRFTEQPGQHLAIVGAGAGGVEIALACRASLPSQTAITLIGPTLLPGLSPRAAKLSRQALEQQQISYRSARVSHATKEAGHDRQSSLGATESDQYTLHLDDQGVLEADQLFWVTDVRAASWLQASGLDCDEQGFLRVDSQLRSISAENIFAAGDTAHLQHQQRAKAGVFSVRAAPVLAHNLFQAVQGLPLGRRKSHFRPQRSFLTLIGSGSRAQPSAIATRGNFALSGKIFWTLKDWIDRRFMARYSQLPQMTPDQPTLPEALANELPDDDMRCGGCGAKLAADPLRRVLARLPAQHGDQVTLGIGDDAALVQHGDGQTLMSVDGFRAMIDDPYLFGRICAHHSLNDLYAMGACPVSALALVTVPLMSERMMEEELFQLLSGAVDVLTAAGAPLVGGHSAEGAELSLALTVTGVPGATTLQKSGASPGDQLLLTKPLGTGVILAAAMRGIHESGALKACVASMDSSNRKSMEILQAHGVKALTDVTGFGLIGHLGEMLRASHCGVSLTLNAVPVLPGALNLAEQGIRSSLAQANSRALADFDCSTMTDAARLALLADPQTSGGLLACVSSEQADPCLQALREADVDAQVIGQMMPSEHWRIH